MQRVELLLWYQMHNHTLVPIGPMKILHITPCLLPAVSITYLRQLVFQAYHFLIQRVWQAYQT